ncbi:hypothetical protein [Stenotrophomonas phage vB_SmaS_P15]|uniref:Uncharacterized protein n=1 Tax=Stenotrophomonas phage vB_SmaS_P15 TaxID=2894592 RepID=A0AAE9C6T2_9CAUD|nr:hypothetical protein [Stenotrophomonas phage vB_SmaS_P15]
MIRMYYEGWDYVRAWREWRHNIAVHGEGVVSGMSYDTDGYWYWIKLG